MLSDGTDVARIPSVLDCRQPLSSTDLSLLSWLECIGIEQFSLPFEQRTLDYAVTSIKQPQLQVQIQHAKHNFNFTLLYRPPGQNTF